MRNYVFWGLNIINIINIILVMLNILPRENWWLTLLIFNLVGVTGAVYFIEIFGTRRGCLYAVIVFLLIYLISSQAKLLPFITDDSLYAHVIYISVAALWVGSLAISQAFTYRMTFSMRAIFTMLIIIFIQFFIIPVIALFSQYHNGDNEFFHYQIQLSGYLVIIGFIIICFIFLLVVEILWLVNYSSFWQTRMEILFVIISGIAIVVGFKDGLWQTSVVCFLIMFSLLVVANSKKKGDYTS